MRVVREVVHPQCRITVFSWNGKYLLKFERGLIEQTYKVPETEIYEEDTLDKLIHQALLPKVLARFKEMEQDLIQALETMYE